MEKFQQTAPAYLYKQQVDHCNSQQGNQPETHQGKFQDRNILFLKQPVLQKNIQGNRINAVRNNPDYGK